MKRLILLVFFISVLSFAKSQNFVVINDSIYGGFDTQFPVTYMTSISEYGCNNEWVNYFFDFNKDGIDDVKFYLSCYMGGQGGSSIIRVDPLNDFQVLTDTNYQAYGQYFLPGYGFRDTIIIRTTVKRFDDGDTIRTGEPFKVGGTDIYTINEGYNPDVTYLLIDEFLGDTAYMAFYNVEDGMNWIYYLKVFNSWIYGLEILSVHSNDLVLDVTKPVTRNQIAIYPNPVSQIAHIKGDIDKVELYTVHGTLVFDKKISQHQTNINLSYLPPGFYFARLIKGDNIFIQKILKN